jgi:hypothetical protein
MLARISAALLAALLLTGCAATRQLGAGSAMPTPIPWLPLIAGQQHFPTPPPLVIPPDTPPCRASDVVIQFGGAFPPGSGVPYTVIGLRNRTGSRCFLAGVPGVRLLSAGGTEIVLAFAPMSDWPDWRNRPIPLAPHADDPDPHGPDQGSVTLEWLASSYAARQGCPHPASPASAIALRLPGDSTETMVTVPGDPLIPCNSPIRVSPFQPFNEPEPPPVPHRLVATLEAPAQVRAGDRLRYTVTLQNITSTPVTFGATCPSYVEGGWKGDPRLGEQSYALNCRPVGAIPAGGTITFAMEFAVPSSASAVDLLFSWTLGRDFDSDATARGTIRVTE